MDHRSLFFDAKGLLRSGWRFAIFCIAFFVTTALLSSPLIAMSTEVPPGIYRVANILVGLVAALLVGWLCGKYLERLPFSALGAWFTKGWLTHLLAGLLMGAGSLAFAVLIAFLGGGLRFQNNPVDLTILMQSLAYAFVILAAGAAAEEAIFRGYVFQTFTRSGLAWFAILLTSVFFGAAHLMNPEPGFISTLNTVLAGVWFGIAYLKTRDLWFVFGMHFMWNWMQGAIFGIEISGFTDFAPAPLLKEIDGGPTWLTGSAYGLEGGIAATIALIVSTIAIYLYRGVRTGRSTQLIIDS